jgi:hypothetical protein
MPLRFTSMGWVAIIPFVVLAVLALLIHWYVAAAVFAAIALLLANHARRGVTS